MHDRSRCRPRGASALVVAAALVPLALAACSSSPSSSTTTTTASGARTPATTSSPGTSAPSSASRLSTLAQSLQSAENASFKATYSATDDGKTETLVFEQAPPDLLFSTTGGEVIDTGSATYFCSTSGTPTCLSSSSEDPLAPLLQALSPKTAISSLQAAQAALAAKTAGYQTSFSTQIFAGQSATCVTITEASGTDKVCVTGNGELAYVSTSPSQVFEMTGYSSNVDSSDFSLPAGASVVTVPTT